MVIAAGHAPVRGLALVLVLWVVAALSLLTVMLVRGARFDVQTTGLLDDGVRWQAAADGALALALAQLAGDTGPLLAASVAPIRFEGMTIDVTITSASGYVDINRATEPLLVRLFQYGAGVEPSQALQLARRVIDWRDPDDAALPEGGAERDDYVAAGSAFRPRNAPFEQVADLAQVLGLGPDLNDRIAGLVTTHGDAVGVDPAFAPIGVIEMLAAGDQAIRDAIIAQRQRDDAAPDFTMLDPQLLSRGGVRRLHVEARTPASASTVMRRGWWVEQGDGPDAVMGWKVLMRESGRGTR